LRLKAGYLEGLTAETVPAYLDRAKLVKAMGQKEIPELLKQLDEARTLKGDEARKVEGELLVLRDEHLERLLSLGAPGWLMTHAELAEVRPLDDEGPLAAADPRKADAATLKAREDTIVRNALKGGEPIAVIVLGASHDLTASVRAADPSCGYIRLTTKKVAELVDAR
jgi:hypothetical protein